MKAHVADSKKVEVKELASLMLKYPIIGSVNMENLPTAQLQQIRGKIRDISHLKVSKKRLIKLAIEQIKDKKPAIEGLIESLRGMPALLFTNKDPFKLCKVLDQNKTSVPAKAGQIAPKDIIVKTGSTGFAPGPIISELSGVGLKVGVENGKVAVKEEKILVKEGEEITAKKADVLAKLKIEPMEIGLNLVSVYDNGNIIPKKILSIDESEYENNIVLAITETRNLAMEIAYPVKETIEQLLSKAFNEAKTLALDQNIISDIVIEKMISQAEGEAKSLKSEAKIGDDVEVKAENQKAEKPKEEKAKPEEKKEDIPSAEELVQKTKEFAEGKRAPTAADLVEEIEKESPKAEKKPEAEKVPSLQELAKNKK